MGKRSKDARHLRGKLSDTPRSIKTDDGYDAFVSDLGNGNFGEGVRDCIRLFYKHLYTTGNLPTNHTRRLLKEDPARAADYLTHHPHKLPDGCTMPATTTLDAFAGWDD
ncbi:hypothetical protein D3C85_896570 [compost metagenome]